MLAKSHSVLYTKLRPPFLLQISAINEYRVKVFLHGESGMVPIIVKINPDVSAVAFCICILATRFDIVLCLNLSFTPDVAISFIDMGNFLSVCMLNIDDD